MRVKTETNCGKDDFAESFVRGYLGAKDHGPNLASDLMEALGYHWEGEKGVWCCPNEHPAHPNSEGNLSWEPCNYF